MRDRRDLAGRESQPMIGHCPGQSKAILNHVEAVHRILRLAHSATRNKSAGRVQVAFAAVQKITVECKNDVGFLKLRNQPGIVSEADLRRESLSFAQERIVDAPPHLGKLLLEFAAQTLACW